MKIIRNEQSATLTFVPVEGGEAEVISAVAALLKPGDKLDYGGRSGGDKGEPLIIFLHAGGRRERKDEKIGNLTINREVHIDSIELKLCGSAPDDDREVRGIRDTCFFGSSGLIFLGEVEMDGVRSVVITAMRCKLCGGNMLGMGECEWRTCSACKDKCEHRYVHGMVHGGDVGDMGMGEYCDKCGRSKPEDEDERKMSKLEHHLAVERELGVHVFYKDSHIETPSDAVQLARLARRYARARRRTLSVQKSGQV